MKQAIAESIEGAMSGPKIIIPKTDTQEFEEMVKTAVANLPSEFQFFHNAVVVAKFIRTKIGSIYTSKDTQTEDKWQGKCGFVVAIGPSAFQNEPGFDFHGHSVKAGDWVIYRHTDGWDFDYSAPGRSEKLHFRLLEDTHIKGRVMRPELVW